PQSPTPPPQERKEKNSAKLLNQKSCYPIYKVSGGTGRPTSNPVDNFAHKDVGAQHSRRKNR
ncbi:hypothetical protein OPM64_16670, partial [Weizmannia coagulans]